jgi:hypothetical protein
MVPLDLHSTRLESLLLFFPALVRYCTDETLALLCESINPPQAFSVGPITKQKVRVCSLKSQHLSAEDTRAQKVQKGILRLYMNSYVNL